MTEQATDVRPSILDDVKVELPEHSSLRTKKYMCGIRRLDDTKHLEFHIRVGPVCFTTETFEWDGKGEGAKQVFKKGAIYDLTDAQVLEVKEKIGTRYLRKHFKRGLLTGVSDIDTSDLGSIIVDAQGVKKRMPPQIDKSRLVGGETPLKELVFMLPVYGSQKLQERVVTKAEVEAILRQIEEDENKFKAGDGATFDELEGGKGGKKRTEQAGRAEPRDQAAARAMSTTDGKREAKAGFIPDSK